MLNNLMVKQIKCLFRGHTWKSDINDCRSCTRCSRKEFKHTIGWVRDDLAYVGLNDHGHSQAFVRGKRVPPIKCACHT